MKSSFLAALLVLCLVAVACGSDDGTENTDSTVSSSSLADSGSVTTVSPSSDSPSSDLSADVQELKLGYILPLTGSLAYLGDAMERGATLAVEEINQVGIQRIDMLAGDSGTNADVANNTADNHLAEGVQGIIGAGASAVSLSIIDKITGVGIPMIAASNTSPAFTTY